MHYLPKEVRKTVMITFRTTAWVGKLLKTLHKGKKISRADYLHQYLVKNLPKNYTRI
jgi:hypothetical protein